METRLFSDVLKGDKPVVIDENKCDPAYGARVRKSIMKLKAAIPEGCIRHLADIQVKIKIIGVKSNNLIEVADDIALSNPEFTDIKLDRIYSVRGDRGPYLNAHITCGLKTAAWLKEHGRIKVGGVRLRCFEVVNIRMCTNCYALGHFKSQCTVPRRCKTCSSTTCTGIVPCKPHCYHCKEANNENYHHQTTSHLCPIRAERINELKNRVFL